MKTKILSAISILLIFSACSHKITNPKIEKLEGQQKVLALNTQINDLKLALEREKLKLTDLTDAVNKANELASKSANEAKVLAEKVNENPGNAKLAKNANKAAKIAAKNSKRAKKLTDQLSDAQNNIKDYQKGIDDSQKELDDLNSSIKIIPNQPQEPKDNN